MIDEKHASESKELDRSQPLILDFIGPYVVHFHQDIASDASTRIARIHAPQCPDHHANLLTDSNDASMEPNVATDNVYRFKEKTAPVGADCYACPEAKQLLLMSTDLVPIDKGQCHLILEVPFPNRIVPLIPETIFIHSAKATNVISNPDSGDSGTGCIVNSSRARGLRFIYNKCASKPVLEQIPLPDQFIDLKNVEPEAQGFDCWFPHYHMTVRFASNNTSTDEHHEDAYSCFQQLRTMLDTTTGMKNKAYLDTISWKVDFAPAIPRLKRGPHTENLTGKHPVDCLAGAVVVEDTAITELRIKRATE